MGEALMPRRGGGGLRRIATLSDMTPTATGMTLVGGIVWSIPELATLDDGTYRVHYEQTALLPNSCNYRSRGFFDFKRTGSDFLILGGNYSLYRTYDAGTAGTDYFHIEDETPITSISIRSKALQLKILYGYNVSTFYSDHCSMQMFDLYNMDDIGFDFTTPESFIK